MATPIEALPPLSDSDFTGPNHLFPVLKATVLLCSILVTLLTAARLVTKRLVSTYNTEDCEYQIIRYFNY